MSEEFFSRMNEDYAKKHFPEGSVFMASTKAIKRRSILSLIFLSPFSLGSLYLLVVFIRKTFQYIAEGDEDMVSTGFIICGILALVALLFLFLSFKLSQLLRQTSSDYAASSAKNSQLPVSEIETFERQAMASDCYILKLTSGLDRVLSNNISKDGLLTRDYIYLADSRQTVMRVDSLRACFFTDYTYYLNTGSYSRKIHNLAICLIASNGLFVRTDTDEKAGFALMEILKERNSSIDTNNGKVVPEGRAFDNYMKAVLLTS